MANTEHHDVLFSVRRSIRYHSKRQAFYESVEQWTTFVLLLLGSGVVALALEGLQAWNLAVGFGVALLSGLKLVYAFGSKAHRHARFVGDFTTLEKRLRGDSSGETVAAVTRERLDLEASEPPIKRVLDVICHNELCRAMDYSDEERVRVTRLQRLTANLFNYDDLPLLAKDG